MSFSRLEIRDLIAEELKLQKGIISKKNIVSTEFQNIHNEIETSYAWLISDIMELGELPKLLKIKNLIPMAVYLELDRDFFDQGEKDFFLHLKEYVSKFNEN